VEVLFGEGGSDSKLFVHDLYTAYTKYAAKKGLRHIDLRIDEGHMVGKFYGPGVGQAFVREVGKHCIQRIPPTERNGRKQTSIVTVTVMPLPPSHVLKPLPENELEIITQTGKQKAGGQNANKVASAVRMKHKPTGITVFINGRDQIANRRDALQILTARVNEHYNSKKTTAYDNLRKQQYRGGGRGEKIRTYNLMESRAVDHRTGVKTTKVEDIIYKGDFELLM
jgi:peptide chain release factor 1